MDNNLKEKIIVVFRNDDPSACSDVEHERKIADMFDRYNSRQTLGVVPFHCAGNPLSRRPQRQVRLDENPEMIECLREYAARSGSEIALHGLTHQANRLSCPSRREHLEFEGLGLAEQEEMIARGTEILVENFGTKPCTFIAPWNRLDRNTVLACLRQVFDIVSAGPFTPVVDGIVSLGMNCELATFPSLFERARATGRQSLLVINYHSRFINGEKEFALLERALSLCASSPNVEVLTLEETVRLYPELVRKNNEAAMNMVPQWQVPDTARTRAVIYRRALVRLGIGGRLEQTYSDAHSLYWQGRYEEASQLSALIEGLCKRLLIFGRLAGFGLGIAVGASILGVVSTFRLSSRLHYYVGVITLLLLVQLALRWYLTNKDAKRETLVAALLSVAGAVCVMGIGELILPYP